MSLTGKRTVRVAGLVAVAWTTLVFCRVGSRLLAVGSGARGTPGLIALTAAVNVYWLVAGVPLWALRRYASERLSRRAAIALIGLAAIAVVVGEPIWYGVVLPVFNGRPLPWKEAVIARGDVNLLIVALILAVGWLGDGFGRALARQRQRDELDATLADAELRALTLQLQPHFLFNTLQLAAEAAYDDIDSAKRIVGELQMLLRRTFEFEEQSLVGVADEADFLQSYIAIQQRRFGSRLSVDLRVDPAANALLIPPLLLQPLVENSIQHGLGPLARDGRIAIVLARTGDALTIDVRDNGVGFPTENRPGASAGLGLGVTRRRLNALFPGCHTIDTSNAPGGGALVSIVIPARASVTAAFGPAPAAADSVAGSSSHWWPARNGVVPTVAMAIGGGLIVITVVRAALAGNHSPSIDGPAPPAALTAMWIPVELLALALTVILWRARVVQRWLRRRDSEANTLRSQIADARARIGALRSGKELMLSALSRLSYPRSAAEFDQLIIWTSALIRSLLAGAQDGQSSVELESQLARQYFAVLRSDASTEASHATDFEISLEASHAQMPCGSLAAILDPLVAATGGAARSLEVQAEMIRGSLSIRIQVHGDPHADPAALARLADDIRRVEAQMRQASSTDVALTVERADDGYRATMSVRHPRGHAPLRPFAFN